MTKRASHTLTLFYQAHDYAALQKMPINLFPQRSTFHKLDPFYEKNEKLSSLRTNFKQPREDDVYFHIHHFHYLNSTSREANVKETRAWKASTWSLLSEFHHARHFLEFMLNFKVPFLKGFSKWGLRASCTMPINPTTIIELKEGQEKLREAKKIKRTSPLS